MTQYTINPYTGREVLVGGSTHRDLFYSGAYDQKISGGAKHAAPCFDDEVMDRDGFCRKGSQRSSLEPAYFRGGSRRGSRKMSGGGFDIDKALAEEEKAVYKKDDLNASQAWKTTKNFILNKWDHDHDDKSVKKSLDIWRKTKDYNAVVNGFK